MAVRTQASAKPDVRLGLGMSLPVAAMSSLAISGLLA
jgi:hypothetical protein